MCVHDFGSVILTVTGVTVHDAGVYMCRAVNEHGEAVTTAQIDVQGGLG
jgi:hypothetical protein